MKSSIKIDFIDRGTGVGIEPVIRIELIKSEDPRDTLIAVLFESVAYNKFLQFRHQDKTPSPLSDAGQTILLFKPSMDEEEKALAVKEFNKNLEKVLALVPDKKTKQSLTTFFTDQFNEEMNNCK